MNRWLRSYALVLLIPIVMMLVVYFQTKQVIEDEINRANTALLSQLQQDIDGHIDYTYRLSEMIAFNPKIRQLMRTPENLEAEDRITMVQALTDFKVYNNTNRYVDHFYVYFRTGGFVLTETSYYDTPMYYDLMLSSSGLALEEWKRFLEQKYRGQFFNMQEVEGQAAAGILFAQSLPIDERNTPLATLVIELNEERLLSAIQNIQSYNQGKVYIVDGSNQILASSEKKKQGPRSFDQLNGDLGVVHSRWDNENVVISYIQSNRTNWKYVYVLPSRLYSEKAEYVRNLTLLTLFIALLIGTVLAVLLARRNYYPLRQLVRALAERSKLDPHSALNEYDYIEEAIENTMDRNNEMNQMLEKQKNVLRSSLFVRLLKGRIQHDFPVQQVMSEYKVAFRSEDFTVLLFYLEDFSGFFRQDETDAEKKREFVRLIVSNIVEELTCQQHQGWMVEIDEMLACIVNFKSGTGPEDAKQDLVRIAEEAQRFIGTRFHIYFTAAVSTLHRSVAELPAAYQEALEAMEYKMLLGTQTIIFYDQIKNQGMSYVYPMEKEQQLINYVKAGEFDQAKGVLDEVIHFNLSEVNLSIEMVRCLMFDMISTMMKAAIEVNLGQSELYEENMKAIQDLMNGVTVSAMKDRMTVFLRKVCGHVESKKKSHNFRLKEDILDFINDQYRDHNLSVNTISERFGIHPSYLSRYFKEQVGDTLTDYLNKLRVEKSKLLLLNDEIFIKDICDLVGFYSISTFIRLFKKYEGVTPSSYRESSKY
ncbi:helix-turn-helix domain-containing protein [Paenibacillus sp. LMG 31456]|uniref:Helix-turn-helix domain-containing protein n=1 Tax=Paenibacillus foliorum TaxID=2654974 RepID=A0A972K2D9_9BACL|nr:helix-turn-helix domain-containing protein [Paenibacillus foliorum]NOU95785.1 helix-turn-helix domain-containing protein [Paenibacillus foliorum]